MRTANKKHRNVGDIEIVSSKESKVVIEAWDAKYAKPYLRDELEELDDKLMDNTNVEIAGFVTDKNPTLTKDITKRISELKEKHEVEIRIMSFSAWVDYIVARISSSRDKVGQLWFIAYAESLCQKRREMAPIDEPSEEWVETLKELIDKELNKR